MVLVLNLFGIPLRITIELLSTSKDSGTDLSTGISFARRGRVEGLGKGHGSLTQCGVQSGGRLGWLPLATVSQYVSSEDTRCSVASFVPLLLETFRNWVRGSIPHHVRHEK